MPTQAAANVPAPKLSSSTKRKQRRKDNPTVLLESLPNSPEPSIARSVNILVPRQSHTVSTKANMNYFDPARMNRGKMVVNETASGWTPINAERATRKPSLGGSASNPINVELLESEVDTPPKSLAHRPIAAPAIVRPPSMSKKALPRSEKHSTPSLHSGGVPKPTDAYLSACCSPLRPLSSPQNLLVVIDLNGTLLYRPHRSSATRYRPRLFASEFLKYCTETFHVVIWSSAKPANVSSMCETLISGGLKEKVVAIWGRDKFGLCATDYNTKVQCYKRLTYLWEDRAIATSHPTYLSGGRWDQTNTILIDDSVEKARSEPFNLLKVPEYLGSENEVANILPQVHDYLNFLAMHANVSASIRAKPFQPFEPMHILPTY